VAEGEEYLLRIGGYQGDQGQADLMISCFNDCNHNEWSDAEEVVSGAAPDCNSNMRPDECDVRGDVNSSGVLDVADWPLCHGCLTDPCPAPPCNPALYPHPCCGWVDFEEDGDVDILDVAEFQRRMGSIE
jgi:hypothetical protein